MPGNKAGQPATASTTAERVVNATQGGYGRGRHSRKHAHRDDALDAVKHLSLSEFFTYNPETENLETTIPDGKFGGTAVTIKDSFNRVRFTVDITPTRYDLRDVVETFGPVVWHGRPTAGAYGSSPRDAFDQRQQTCFCDLNLSFSQAGRAGTNGAVSLRIEPGVVGEFPVDDPESTADIDYYEITYAMSAGADNPATIIDA